jgi:hypothetical protein
LEIPEDGGTDALKADIAAIRGNTNPLTPHGAQAIVTHGPRPAGRPTWDGPTQPPPLPIWSLLALGAAGCTTAADLLLRSLLRHGLTARLAMGASCCLTTLLALPLLLLLRPAIAPGALLTALAATALINGVAFWSYGRALARP